MSDLKKIKWETSDLANTEITDKKTLKYRGISGKQRKKTRGNSAPTPVACGGAGAKAPPLAARPRLHEKLQQSWPKMAQAERNRYDSKDIF